MQPQPLTRLASRQEPATPAAAYSATPVFATTDLIALFLPEAPQQPQGPSGCEQAGS
jgi:hypothetical protein